MPPGRPRKTNPIEETSVSIPSLLDEVDFTGLIPSDLEVQNLSIANMPAIVTEKDLQRAQGKGAPANPIVSLVSVNANMVKTETGNFCKREDFIMECKSNEIINSVVEQCKFILGSEFNALQSNLTKSLDSANKELKLEINKPGKGPNLEPINLQVADLSKNQAQLSAQINSIEQAVVSMRLTLLDFLDALNNQKVIVQTQDEKPAHKVEVTINGNMIETSDTLQKATVETSAEEPIIEAEIVEPSKTDPENVVNVSSLRPSKISAASEGLPRKLLTAIKTSPHTGSCRAWAKALSPKVIAAYPGLTENELYLFFASLGIEEVVEGKDGVIINPEKIIL